MTDKRVPFLTWCVPRMQVVRRMPVFEPESLDKVDPVERKVRMCGFPFLCVHACVTTARE